MKSDSKDKKIEVRVELKYCEHCGALWMREPGTGLVYCDNCRPKVADLPIPKKKPTRARLPVRPYAAVEEHGFELGDEDVKDFEAAAGGAA
jgi:hypothetical protein